MNLSDRLVKDFKKYLIEKLTIPKNTVQLLRADILNKSKELQRELSEEEMLEIVAKQIKQKRSALEEFEKCNRRDLVDKTYMEISILNQYMPAPLTLEELEVIIKETASEINATSKKDMGRLMKEIKEQVGVRADGKTISQLVSQLLS